MAARDFFWHGRPKKKPDQVTVSFRTTRVFHFTFFLPLRETCPRLCPPLLLKGTPLSPKKSAPCWRGCTRKRLGSPPRFLLSPVLFMCVSKALLSSSSLSLSLSLPLPVCVFPWDSFLSVFALLPVCASRGPPSRVHVCVTPCNHVFALHSALPVD